MSGQQYPTREQLIRAVITAGVDWEGANTGTWDRGAQVADAVLALFPQSTPSAEGDARANTYRQGWAAGHAAPHIAGVRGDTTPPNIADMAPGTTGLSVEDRLHLASHLRLRAAQIRRGYVGATSAIGNLMGRAADAIDPSTNRDVQEPPTTPEVN